MLLIYHWYIPSNPLSKVTNNFFSFSLYTIPNTDIFTSFLNFTIWDVIYVFYLKSLMIIIPFYVLLYSLHEAIILLSILHISKIKLLCSLYSWIQFIDFSSQI